MRIAQIAPLYESVPPRLYGGTERVVGNFSPKRSGQPALPPLVGLHLGEASPAALAHAQVELLDVGDASPR